MDHRKTSHTQVSFKWIDLCLLLREIVSPEIQKLPERERKNRNFDITACQICGQFGGEQMRGYTFMPEPNNASLSKRKTVDFPDRLIPVMIFICGLLIKFVNGSV